ncbi:MAG: HpcH/HpaI aldolase/citrate lyase family protein [Rhodobacteraceae bacterium]|nr:HpcH/HpaI aldolase/citrate lyase family protein [Paracoccaceae bacterium]
MAAPRNEMKQRLAAGEMQIGLWIGFTHPTVAEITASAGYDFCLIDGEHGPNDVQTILAQLQAMAGGSATPVVRVPIFEEWILKQVLDLGAQSVLIPMIDTPEAARAAVAATRYAPEGRRGLGSALARASGYNAIADYATTANREICVMVQAETREALDNIEEIAGTDGVDVVFIGPADLSADMGYLGNSDHPEVKAAIEEAIAKIRAAGKSAGIITLDPNALIYYKDIGVNFLAVGADITTYGAAVRELSAKARKDLGL